MSKREYDPYELVGQCKGDYICKVIDSDGDWYIIPAYPWNEVFGFIVPVRTMLEGVCMRDAVFCTEPMKIESYIDPVSWGQSESVGGVTKEDAQLFYDYMVKDQEESLAEYPKEEQKEIYRSIEIITLEDAKKQVAEYEAKENKFD